MTGSAARPETRVATPTSEPPHICDLAVVGGGIIGLATARALALLDRSRRVCLLEREPRLGEHQTGHNSGVIHAGIYYQPGSFRARLCTEGARELYGYCESRSIPTARCGKLIIATSREELARLEQLERRARANGAAVSRIERGGIEQIEPHARGLAALHSPDSGVTDFAAVARAYARDFLESGGVISTSCEVLAAEPVARRLQIRHSRGATEVRHAVFCAGAWSDRLARAAGGPASPRIVPFRGAYQSVCPERRHLVRALVYPVPDPALPFLGVHLTRTVDGEVLIGPSARLAASRGAAGTTSARSRDVLDSVCWPGTWWLAARWRRSVVAELRRAVSGSALLGEAARLVPELEQADAVPAFAGVRGQALDRRGHLVEDFIFSRTERALHVRNAPSPAATASLGIARHVAAVAQRALSLDA